MPLVLKIAHDESTERGWRRGDCRITDFLDERSTEFRIGKNRGDIALYLVDNRVRRVLRSEQTEPRPRVDVGKACFLQRRYIWEGGDAFTAADRKRLQLSGLGISAPVVDGPPSVICTSPATVAVIAGAMPR